MPRFQRWIIQNGPLTRYVKMRIVHAPGTFSPSPTPNETASASLHVRDALPVTHVGSLTPGGGKNVEGWGGMNKGNYFCGVLSDLIFCLYILH